MRKIVNGVELDNSMEIVQEELTPDGIDLNSNIDTVDESSVNAISSAEQDRLTAITSNWDSFKPYMEQVYSTEIFEPGYQIVAQHRE